jgi:hypothetical protein
MAERGMHSSDQLAVLDGLASASKLAPPEMKAQVESVFRSALSET